MECELLGLLKADKTEDLGPPPQIIEVLIQNREEREEFEQMTVNQFRLVTKQMPKLGSNGVRQPSTEVVSQAK